MRRVFQVVGLFSYRGVSIEDVRSECQILENALSIIPDLCKIFMGHTRGSDTFSSTFYVREAWTDSPWLSPLTSDYIDTILKRKYYEAKRSR